MREAKLTHLAEGLSAPRRLTRGLGVRAPRPALRVPSVAASFVLALVLSLVLAGCSTATNTATPRGSASVAWVATGSYMSQPGDTVTPVNVNTGQPGRPLGTGRLPSGIAVTPNGAELLVTNTGDDTLAVVNLATKKVVARVPVGLEPDSVAVAPGRNGSPPTALVTNFGANTVTPVNLSTLRAARPVPVGSQPDAIAVASGGPANSGVALVADFASGQVTPIDLATMQPQPPIGVGAEPDAIAVYGTNEPSPTSGSRSSQLAHGTGEIALVANFGSNTISPISLATATAAPQIGLPGDPTGIAVAPNGTAWVSNSGFITPIQTPTLTVGNSLALSGVAEGVAIAPGARTAWVTLQNGVVTCVSLANGAVEHSVSVGGRPSTVVITS